MPFASCTQCTRHVDLECQEEPFRDRCARNARTVDLPLEKESRKTKQLETPVPSKVPAYPDSHCDSSLSSTENTLLS
jgi:hypothetical protein